MPLAKRHEAKGEGEIAAEYFVMAGDDKTAEAVQQQTGQRRRQAEEGRKKHFTKEQADLEKALGFQLRCPLLLSGIGRTLPSISLP